MTEQRITTAEDVAETTGQDVGEVKESLQKIAEGQKTVKNMSEQHVSVYDEHLTEEQVEELTENVDGQLHCVTILFSTDINIPLKLRANGRTKVASLDIDWDTEWSEI